MLTYIFWALAYLLSRVSLLPIKDDRGRHHSFPTMTVGLIALNTIVFVLFNLLPLWIDSLRAIVVGLVPHVLLVPADVFRGEGLGALSMVTAAFLHADLWHLLGNMLILFFFGRKVEDVLGPAKFMLFYLVCTFVAGMGSVLGRYALPLDQGEGGGLGASGAIMGIVGAYLFLYSEQRIRTLVVLAVIPIPFTVSLPAWVYILYTVLTDISRGWLQTAGVISSFVDSFTHLGGVIAGLTCLYLFLPGEMLHYRHRPGKSL